jgi:hypothetical protein
MPFIDPVAAGLYARPSTLAGVVRMVKEIFDSAGDATPILVGKRYVDQTPIGRVPRIVFVPDEPGRGGKVGAPIEMGNAASVTHACQARCRGREDGDDITRYDAAYLLADKVVTAIRRAATGRLEFGPYEDTSPTDVDAYGAEISFRFLYERDVPHTPEVVGVAAAPEASDEPVPSGMEHGERGTVDELSVVVTPEDEAIP